MKYNICHFLLLRYHDTGPKRIYQFSIGMPDKSKEDRLKETLRLLKELGRVGFSEVDVGYSEVKGILSQWVKDGEAVEAEVEFPRYYRVAKISLPKTDERAGGITLKTTI
jgi:hypothetical protein